jgi:glycosyltransferase involved in cell wall biosynthesis
LIYPLAREQARLGHQVSLVLYGPPDASARSFAKETGIRFVQLPEIWTGPTISKMPSAALPDIVHMHSVFIPQQWALGRALDELFIPYVITPNGGLSPHILARSRPLKAVYSRLIEKPRFRRARGISVVTPDEETEVRSFVPNYRGPLTWIPNTFDPDALEDVEWSPNGSPTVVYLGRFDVRHKGIDILLEIARRLPHIDFHLYGPDDKKSKERLAALRQRSTPNVFIHGPVYGAEKASVLSRATLYLQMSRWEAFGVSIAEAMYLGLPCVLASTMHLASVLKDRDLGLVVPPDPSLASESIVDALAHPQRMQRWSKASRTFARSTFRPSTVASQFLGLYQECLRVRQHYSFSGLGTESRPRAARLR